MSKFTLLYFNLEGRAGPIRNICAIGKVPYVDQIVKGEDWPKLKPTLPHGQLPVIRVGDLTINQSTDIIRYVSKLAGLYPRDPLDALQADALLSNMNQILDDTVAKLFTSNIAKDDAIKMGREFLDKKEGKVGILFEKLDLQIGVGSGYLFDFGLTGTDLQFFQWICLMSMGIIVGIPKTYIRDNFENLEAYRHRIASIKEISSRFQDEKDPLYHSIYTVDFKYDNDEKKAE